MNCSCGKMWTASYMDTLRQYILERRIAHDVHNRAVYFYQCAEEGTWHWSRMFIQPEQCTCFEHGYKEYETAWKRCDVNSTRNLTKSQKRSRYYTPKFTKLPYQCAGGRWHIQLVEGRKHVEKCRCGMWAFVSKEKADLSEKRISAKFPQNEFLYQATCNFGGLHLYNTRAYKEINSDARARYRGGEAVAINADPKNP